MWLWRELCGLVLFMNEIDIEHEIKQRLAYDYFKLFELKYSFTINEVLLRKQYQKLQQKFHPDNFVKSRNPVLKSLALQLSAHINSGYVALKSPLLRIQTLFKIHNIPFDLTTDTRLPSDFLMTQLELQEEIEEAQANQNTLQLEKILTTITTYISELNISIELEYSAKHWDIIKILTKKLAFYAKLSERIADSL